MRDISKRDSLEQDVERIRQLILALGRRRPLRDPISTTIEESGLTPPQLHALLWLGTDGPLTMGELARRIGSTEKTLTGIVDRMERAGYLQRERDANDRRVVRSKLTRKGLALHRKLDAQMRARMTRVLGLLDPEDRRDLFRILDKFLSRVPSLDAPIPLKEGGR